MKKVLAGLAMLSMLAMFTGCITIQQGPVNNTTAAPEDTKAPDNTTAAPEETTASEAADPEETTAEEGGHHEVIEPETDESGMRYSFKWLAGLYEHKGEMIDGSVPTTRLRLYENGTFVATFSMAVQDGYYGNYVVIGDTIYLNTWFTTGGDIAAQFTGGLQNIIGINMDRTLVCGDDLFELGRVLQPLDDSEAEAFDGSDGFVKVLDEMLLENGFLKAHPEVIKL